MSRKDFAGIAAAFVVVLVLSVAMRHYFIDDAYIGFRYIDNAVHGQGFVFNPPDRIEGVTNIGWLLFLWPFARIVPVTLAAKILSVLLVLATLAATLRIASHASRDQDNRYPLFFLPLLIALDLNFAVFSMSGMETPLLAFGLVALIILAERERSLPVLAILTALMFLVRPECAAIFPLALVFWNGLNTEKWKTCAPSLLLFVSMVLLFTLARKFYFGSFLPNTFYAKSTAWKAIGNNALRFLKGTNPNIPLPFIGFLALPVWAAGFSVIRRRNGKSAFFLLAALTTGILFAVYANPDWTGMGRYFAPYVPLAMLLLIYGFADLVKKLSAFLKKPGAVLRTVVPVLCGSIVLIGAARIVYVLLPEQIGEYPGYVLTSAALVEPSLWMRDHLPEKAMIATGRIGAIGYFSRKRIFDYKFGLTDPAVARLPRDPWRPFDDPRDPALEKIWLGMNPDYYLEDLRRIREIFRTGPGRPPLLKINGLEYRILKIFRIGNDADWALYERTGLSQPGDPAPRTGGSFAPKGLIEE
ncbi:MAG: hypothetical protein ABSF88_06155 [Candidatus Aminicenantales bacterium]